MAKVPGDFRRARVGNNQELTRLDHAVARRQNHVRPDKTRDNVDLILVQQLLGLLLANFRLNLIVFEQDLDRNSAHLAAEMIERDHDRIAHILADNARATRQRCYETDLDLFRLGRERLRTRESQRQRGSRKYQGFFHPKILPCEFFFLPTAPTGGNDGLIVTHYTIPPNSQFATSAYSPWSTALTPSRFSLPRASISDKKSGLNQSSSAIL